MSKLNKSDAEELESRLTNLSSKINSLQINKANGSIAGKKHRGMGGASVGLQVMIELVVALLVGGGIGYSMDGLLDTKPLFLVVFFLLGGVAGILNVVRLSEKQKRQQANNQTLKVTTLKSVNYEN